MTVSVLKIVPVLLTGHPEYPRELPDAGQQVSAGVQELCGIVGQFFRSWLRSAGPCSRFGSSTLHSEEDCVGPKSLDCHKGMQVLAAKLLELHLWVFPCSRLLTLLDYLNQE